LVPTRCGSLWAQRNDVDEIPVVYPFKLAQDTVSAMRQRLAVGDSMGSLSVVVSIPRNRYKVTVAPADADKLLYLHSALGH
jgi:hypothetical protein